MYVGTVGLTLICLKQHVSLHLYLLGLMALKIDMSLLQNIVTTHWC